MCTATLKKCTNDVTLLKSDSHLPEKFLFTLGEEILAGRKFGGIGGNLIWRMQQNCKFGGNLVWWMTK